MDDNDNDRYRGSIGARPIELVGRVFGYLTVLRREGSVRNNPTWLCRCDCGCESEIVAYGHRLRSGVKTKCSGQAHGDLIRQQPLTYGSWEKMKERCAGSDRKHRKAYSDRGIRVCDRWLNSFAAFFADMGARPGADYTIERDDVNGNYEPGNCRWIPASEQGANTTRTIYIDVDGTRQRLIEVCRERGLSYAVVRGRLVNGWPIEKALSTPVRAKKRACA